MAAECYVTERDYQRHWLQPHRKPGVQVESKPVDQVHRCPLCAEHPIDPCPHAPEGEVRP